MTLSRDGWISDRPFCLIRERDGTPVAFHCLRCGTETVPDQEAFASHFCHKSKAKKEMTHND